MRNMRNAMFVLLLLVSSHAFGVGLDIRLQGKLEPVDSPRKAKVLRNARGGSAFTLPDGSLWITHSVPAKREPSAIGVTRFGTDGSARVFLLSDWLPKGTIPRGSCGQVYGVGQLDDGRIIASGGWNDGHGSHNAIFVLSAREDGTYAQDKVIEFPGGVSQLVGGPGNTILAVTNEASRRGGGPLLTLFDLSGRKIGGLLGDRMLPPLEASRNARAARLQRIDGTRFALYDPAAELIHVFNLEREGPDGSVWGGGHIIFIGGDAATAALPVIGFHAAPDGDLVVARVGRMRGTPGTLLTVYGPDHSVKETTVLDHPWNLMIHEKGLVRGVVQRGDVVLDTVRLSK